MPATAYARHVSTTGRNGLSGHERSYSDCPYTSKPFGYDLDPLPLRSQFANYISLNEGWGSRASQEEDWDPRSSAETYASTVPSAEDYDETLPAFQTPDEEVETETRPSSAIRSSTQEFADYFPSTRRITIKHDDSTLDGNMNLRLDTPVPTSDGSVADLTLFHLRMHDLKRREFSLRRHCRDSGREVCHSRRKEEESAGGRRPGFKRSMSNALSNLRPGRSDSKAPAKSSLTTQDSGYDSMLDEDISSPTSPNPSGASETPSVLGNTVCLEFSNYAHLEVNRRGSKSSKRYEFEYWGNRYAWRRVVKVSGDFRETSYHLINTATAASIAHIVPIPLSPSEAREEEEQGGWVFPCSMWISDESVLDSSLDVADAIVASGLIALVDDTIRHRWHQKRRVQISLPALAKTPVKSIMEPMSPKKIIGEVFNRRERNHPTPVRHNTS